MNTLKVKPYAVYTTDMEVPYAFSLTSYEPKVGILIAPVFLNFGRLHSPRPSGGVIIPQFRKKAIIAVDQMQIIPIDRLIKRIWNMGEQSIAEVLRALQETVKGYKYTEERLN